MRRISHVSRNIQGPLEGSLARALKGVDRLENGKTGGVVRENKVSASENQLESKKDFNEPHSWRALCSGKKSSFRNSLFGDKVKHLYIGKSRTQRLHLAYWISEVALLRDASIGYLTVKFDFLGRLVDFQSLSVL